MSDEQTQRPTFERDGAGNLDQTLRPQSWEEYVGDKTQSTKNDSLCMKKIILGQFKNRKEYKTFAEETLVGIKGRRYEENVPDLDSLLLE